MRAFLPASSEGFVFDDTLAGGTVIVGEGQTYTAVDRGTGSKIRGTYSDPPLRGSALFVCDDDGWVTIEKKETGYITPPEILELLAERIRASADESTYLSVNTSMLVLHDEVEQVIAFVEELDTLTKLELSGFRAPNPHEQSDVIDRARRARIGRITQESDDTSGMDRDSELIRDELEHSRRRYARITRVEGTHRGKFAGIRITDERTDVGVHVEGDSEQDLLREMHRHLVRLKSRLRRVGREPL